MALLWMKKDLLIISSSRSGGRHPQGVLKQLTFLEPCIFSAGHAEQSSGQEKGTKSHPL